MLRRLVLYTAVLAAPLVVASCRSDSITAPASAKMQAVVVIAEPPVRHPIIFVHGYSSRGAKVWDVMVQRFLADGWSTCPLTTSGSTTCPLVAWSYISWESNATIAADLAKEVERVLTETGASRVDIVTHSMGGLSSRRYLRDYYRPDATVAAKVDAWVSLGGPNHGTLTANWCSTSLCREMRPGSAFLKDLNAGDETPGDTPGGVRYKTFSSRCDGVIIPESTVWLTGATNVRTACLSHDALTTDLVVYRQVRDWVHPYP